MADLGKSGDLKQALLSEMEKTLGKRQVELTDETRDV